MLRGLTISSEVAALSERDDYDYSQVDEQKACGKISTYIRDSEPDVRGRTATTAGKFVAREDNLQKGGIAVVIH